MNKGSFNSSYPICKPLYLFLSPDLNIQASFTASYKTAEADITLLLPMLRGKKHLTFSPLSMLLAIGFLRSPESG